MSDANFMRLCFDLAKRPRGNVSPNPYVGAVLVKNGKILGKGFHRGPGLPHAEIEALNNASESPGGATLYCNLEPCCHANKRTPPCAQRLIKEEIAKVIVSNLDPNPQVAGQGLALLERAGVKTESGLLREEGEELNEVFFKHIVRKRPFVHLKWAQTLDGKIATPSGSSKWITSEAARERVHWERMGCDAVMAGAQTLRDDNPSLTVRAGDKIVKETTRIVLASKDDFDRKLKFFSDQNKDKSLLLLPEGAQGREDVRTLYCPADPDGILDLDRALEKLYAQGVCSVYVEGGSSLLTRFFKQGLCDRLSVYIAPKLLGAGISPLGDLGIEDINQALKLKAPVVERLGEDIFIGAKGAECLPD